MECSSGSRRWKGRSMVKLVVLFLLAAISLSCFCRGRSVLHLDSTRPTDASCPDQACYSGRWRRWQRRRLFEGPGSYPPRCASKCGDCNPCYPVHVSVPPGVPVTTEYYPEAWRCKCGNRLYMP